MRIKQGGYRSMPDGFLHLNNFSHSVKSGIAGSIYERVLTSDQQKAFQRLMFELAIKLQNERGETLVHEKHDTYRYKKEFLMESFKTMLYGYLKLVRKQPNVMLSLAVTGEIMQVAEESGIPTLRFK